MNKLGIIGAMQIEVDALQQKMEACELTQIAGMEFYSGILNGVSAVVVQCGVGKVNAAMCVQILCDRFQVSHIVNTGVAGSLCNELDIGDLVISEDAVYHDFDCHVLNYRVGQVPDMSTWSFPADPELSKFAYKAAHAVNPNHVKIGRIASGDQFVCQKELKNTIIENTGALCTEMEGAAIAHAAYRNQTPFVVIRAISDKADDSAEMDYPTFEKIAAQRCAAVTIQLAGYLADL